MEKWIKMAMGISCHYKRQSKTKKSLFFARSEAAGLECQVGGSEHWTLGKNRLYWAPIVLGVMSIVLGTNCSKHNRIHCTEHWAQLVEGLFLDPDYHLSMLDQRCWSKRRKAQICSAIAFKDLSSTHCFLLIMKFAVLQFWFSSLQILGIICMACAAPAQTIDRSGNLFGLGHNHFFLFIVVTTFIISLVWTFFYLLQVKDTIKVRALRFARFEDQLNPQVKLPFTFMKLEVIFTLLATVFYIVAWIVVLSGFGWCTTRCVF